MHICNNSDYHSIVSINCLEVCTTTQQLLQRIKWDKKSLNTMTLTLLLERTSNHDMYA
jgi:hypothetical protein